MSYRRQLLRGCRQGRRSLTAGAPTANTRIPQNHQILNVRVAGPDLNEDEDWDRRDGVRSTVFVAVPRQQDEAATSGKSRLPLRPSDTGSDTPTKRSELGT